ncbi:MAG TPA: hypothetical protein VIV60_07925 [Polyangiaceae bacterium]
MRRHHALLFLICLTTACGGEVQPQPDGDGGQSNHDEGTGGSGGTGQSSSSPRSTLGDCNPGIALNRVDACDWSTDDGMCYPSRQAACNCICPRDGAAVTCLSDFPEPGLPTVVYCISN